MEYSQAIKNLKTNILKIKEGLDILDKNYCILLCINIL